MEAIIKEEVRVANKPIRTLCAIQAIKALKDLEAKNN
jgi:hypothetical protein